MPPETLEDHEDEFDPALWKEILTYQGKAEWVAVSETEVVASGYDPRDVLKRGAKQTSNPALIRVPKPGAGSYIL